MGLILLVVAAIMVGYAIPVVSSLVFSLAVGRIAPGTLAQVGRLKPGFLVAHGVVWTLASLAAGYVVASMLPQFRMVACAGAAALLIAALIANVGEMKKQQGVLRIGGMVLGTVAGFAAGLMLFLRVGQGG